MSRMPSVSEMSEIIGCHGTIKLQGITAPVTVVDVRWVFGRFELLVEGEKNGGTRWVQAVGFTLEKEG